MCSGGRAGLVWGGPGSHPYCDEDTARDDAPAEGHASEVELPADSVAPQENGLVEGVVATADVPDSLLKKPKKKDKKKSGRNRRLTENDEVNLSSLEADSSEKPLLAPVAGALAASDISVATAATAVAAAVASPDPDQKHKRSHSKKKQDRGTFGPHEERKEGEVHDVLQNGTPPLSIAAAATAVRGILRFKARGSSIPSSGVSESSSSSSESDLTELEEKAMRELAALKDERERLLAAMRQQEFSADGEKSTETGRAQIKFVEGEESEEESSLDSLYSDGSDAAAAARQKLLEQQLQHMQEQQQRLEALKVQLNDTEAQLAEAKRLGEGMVLNMNFAWVCQTSFACLFKPRLKLCKRFSTAPQVTALILTSFLLGISVITCRERFWYEP